MGPFAAECCIAVSGSSAHWEASGPPSDSNQVQLAFPPYGLRHHLGNLGYFRPFCCSVLGWQGSGGSVHPPPPLCPTCFQISAVFSEQEGAADGKPSSLTWSIAGLSWLLSLFSGLLSSAYHLHWVKVFFSQGMIVSHSQISHSQDSLHPAGKGTDSREAPQLPPDLASACSSSLITPLS